MPDIYLLIEGQQTGPYSEEQVRQSLADGLIHGDQLAWHEGLAEWGQVVGLLDSEPGRLPLQNDQVAGGLTFRQKDITPKAADPSPPAVAESRPTRKFKCVWIAVTAIAGVLVLAVSIGLGVGLVLSRSRAPLSQPIAGTESATVSQPIVVTEQPYTPSTPSDPTKSTSVQTTQQTGSTSDGETQALKISYLYKEDDAIIVSNDNGEGKFAVYGLPDTFSDGDVWQGPLYPAGSMVDGDKRLHAYALTKEQGDLQIFAQKRKIEALKDQIESDRRLISGMDTIIKEGQDAGGDTTEPQAAKQKINDDLESAQTELSKLQ